MAFGDTSIREPWTVWLDEHGWRLLAHARQLHSCPSDAEDLVQEVVLELWRREPGGSPPDLPLALCKLRQRAIDHGRSRSSRVQREQGWQSEQEVEDGPRVACDQDFQQRHIQRALDCLDEKFREVVSLKLWSELSFDEIGEVLAISRNTAASRYRLALEKLKPLLASIRS